MQSWAQSASSGKREQVRSCRSVAPIAVFQPGWRAFDSTPADRCGVSARSTTRSPRIAKNVRTARYVFENIKVLPFADDPALFVRRDRVGQAARRCKPVLSLKPGRAPRGNASLAAAFIRSLSFRHRLAASACDCLRLLHLPRPAVCGAPVNLRFRTWQSPRNHADFPANPKSGRDAPG